MGFGLLMIFLVALASPLIYSKLKDKAKYVFALFPLSYFFYLIYLGIQLPEKGYIYEYTEWLPSLGIHFSFYLDGLSLLFGLLITGIGTLIVLYGAGYLGKHKHVGRFFLYLFLFMGAMIGLVLSSNLMTLFVFWELTSLSSFLLIGFNHEDEGARKSALQALIITASGGLALLAGLVLTGIIAGSYEMSVWLISDFTLTEHPLYLSALILILAGCFTKSAQMPFHFWLPNAMAAPTPVSAYLHSATMVKVGIYLMARLSPTFGGTEVWTYTLTAVGGVTMFVGAIMAVQHTDLKKILAYTTISALGILTMLIGIGTPLAIKAAVVFLLAHAMYKGALFMIAGNIDHETGTRMTDNLGGLFKKMPVTGTAAVLAAFSMAGLPPLFGFIGKEMIYEAALESGALHLIVTAAVMVAGVIFVSLAILLSYKIFFSAYKPTPFEAHEAPWTMLAGPVVLSVFGILIGFLPIMGGGDLLTAAASAISVEPILVKISFWHGFNLVLQLSIITVILGILLYFFTPGIVRHTGGVASLSKIGPLRIYENGFNGLLFIAKWQTKLLQNGYLRYYIGTIFLTLTCLLLWLIISRGLYFFGLDLSTIKLYDPVLAIITIAAILFTVMSDKRIPVVLTLGIVGYGIAVFYAIYGGTDLSMTQFLIETLTVVVFVFVLYKLPGMLEKTQQNYWRRIRHIGFASVFGMTMMFIILIVTEYPADLEMKRYFAENSYLLGEGRNIVNVILVDFRAADTFGELVVLSIAAIGVFALMNLRLTENKKPNMTNSFDRKKLKK